MWYNYYMYVYVILCVNNSHKLKIHTERPLLKVTPNKGLSRKYLPTKNTLQGSETDLPIVPIHIYVHTYVQYMSVCTYVHNMCVYVHR